MDGTVKHADVADIEMAVFAGAGSTFGVIDAAAFVLRISNTSCVTLPDLAFW
jgi:hypothetical protein